MSSQNFLEYTFWITILKEFNLTCTLNDSFARTDFRHALALEPQNKTALAAERRLQKLLK
jgi:hypothetical protein